MNHVQNAANTPALETCSQTKPHLRVQYSTHAKLNLLREMTYTWIIYIDFLFRRHKSKILNPKLVGIETY